MNIISLPKAYELLVGIETNLLLSIHLVDLFNFSLRFLLNGCLIMLVCWTWFIITSTIGLC